MANDDDLIFQQEILRHPNYSAIEKTHDIALIRLLEWIIFSPSIRPACLETSSVDVPNLKLYVVGWGHTDSSGECDSVEANRYLFLTICFLLGSPSEDLLKASLRSLSNQDCNQIYLDALNHIKHPFSKNGLIQGQMCAQGLPGTDACNVSTVKLFSLKRLRNLFLLFFLDLYGF